ncbi:hypothetical protein NHQ30_004865 [Ciborinia camelliae]|nr:hypothetical protein NHQ30_004865 [Ciborinia camelliae]
MKSGTGTSDLGGDIMLPSGAAIIDCKKTFTPLGKSCLKSHYQWNILTINQENSPEVMNALAAKLGLSPALKFYDVPSLQVCAQELVDLIPRPIYALLVIMPLTPTWEVARRSRDLGREPYNKCGADEPVIWFKETIGNACGSIGLLHCLLNGPAKEYILPNTTLSRLYEESIPLKRERRAMLLYEDTEFEEAHQASAQLGDSLVPIAPNVDDSGLHCVAFVRGEDGYCWELEGSRPGPVRRARLEGNEDLFSPVVWNTLATVIIDDKEASGGDLRFSCIALAADPAEPVSLPLNFLHRGPSVRAEGVARRSLRDPSYVHEKWSPPPSD